MKQANSVCDVAIFFTDVLLTDSLFCDVAIFFSDVVNFFDMHNTSSPQLFQQQITLDVSPPSVTLPSNESASEGPKTKKQRLEPDTKLEQCCAHFIENNWKLVSSVTMRFVSQPLLLKRIDGTQNLMSLFFKFLPENLWNLLVSVVNRNLVQGRSSSSPVRSCFREVNVAELVRFYGLMVLIENTYGNNTTKLRSHFSMVSESCGGVKKLRMDRFQALWRAFNPSIDELRQIADILHSVWSSFIENVSLVTVDETLVAYQPSPKKKQQAESLGEPIPVVYIPRKPHSNGLEAFLLASYVPHPARENAVLPFIIDIYPHLIVGDSPPQDVVRTFMQRWQIHAKPHFVGDSAFGSFGLMKEIQQ
jgi:hypothetical protein